MHLAAGIWKDGKDMRVDKNIQIEIETGGKGGGGRKDFAQAGGQDQNKIDEAFEKIKALI